MQGKLLDTKQRELFRSMLNDIKIFSDFVHFHNRIGEEDSRIALNFTAMKKNLRIKNDICPTQRYRKFHYISYICQIV
jgi:hypothetical protein